MNQLSNPYSKDPLYCTVQKAFDISGISAGDTFIAAVSGGPDSMAMLTLLNQIVVFGGGKVICAHYVHGIRCLEDGRREEQHVQDYCARLGVKFESRSYAQGKMAEDAGKKAESLEAFARTERYRFFYELKNTYKADYIVLGHTYDDQVETLVQRFFQGAGVRGLRGIKLLNDSRFRPLLAVEKSDILRFLHQYSIPWKMDSSNRETEYLRNQVRLELVPAIERIFPGFRKSVTQLSEKMTLQEGVLESAMADKALWRKVGERWEYPLPAYLLMPEGARGEFLLQFLNCQEIGSERLPFGVILQAVKQNHPCTLIKRDNWQFCIGKDYLFWERDIVVSPKKSYLIEVTDCGKFFEHHFSFTVHHTTGIPAENSVSFLKDQVEFPILVRSRMDGDSIVLKSGRIKLKDLFIQWGVPESLKDVLPVLEDRKGIIGVAGLWAGFKDRIAGEYKITGNKSDSELLEFVFSINSALE